MKIHFMRITMSETSKCDKKVINTFSHKLNLNNHTQYSLRLKQNVSLLEET